MPIAENFDALSIPANPLAQDTTAGTTDSVDIAGHTIGFGVLPKWQKRWGQGHHYQDHEPVELLHHEPPSQTERERLKPSALPEDPRFYPQATRLQRLRDGRRVLGAIPAGQPES